MTGPRPARSIRAMGGNDIVSARELRSVSKRSGPFRTGRSIHTGVPGSERKWAAGAESRLDRKSTRLNSSHGYISYAVFCLKKKKQHKINDTAHRRIIK